MQKQVNSFAEQFRRVPVGMLSNSFLKCCNWLRKSGHYRTAEVLRRKRDETLIPCTRLE